MTFSTSLIAHSICALAALPETANHDGSKVAFANLFASFGGKVTVEKQIRSPFMNSNNQPKIWEIDLFVEFADFNVIVEVAAHVSRGPQAMVHENVNVYQTKKYGIRTVVSRSNTHEVKMKQALAYATVENSKPTVCVVMSNKEFLAFNPNTFKTSTLVNTIRKSGISPSKYDTKANAWVKRSLAFKLIKKQDVASIGKCDPDTFVRYLRALAFGQTVKAPRAIKVAMAG